MPKDTGLDELVAASTNTPEILSFYGGEVTLLYDAPLHAYYVIEDGQKILVSGSTTVGAMIDKSAPLMCWTANETAAYVIANAPVEKNGVAHSQLIQAYNVFRNKGEVPEDAAQEQIVFTSRSLAKLLNEARANFRTLSKNATDIGTVAHEWLEGYIKAQIAGEEYKSVLPSDDDITVNAVGKDFALKADNCVKAALDWFGRHKVRFLFAERKLYSRLYNYAGTTDWFGYVTACGDPNCCKHEGEELVCGDFKSSRSLYEEYYIQLASYMQAWNEEFPEQPVTGRLLLRLDKDGDGIETAYRAADTFDFDFDAFLGALAIYGWAKQLELDRKYEKAVIKAEKAAAKAAAAANKPKRKPRKIVIKEPGGVAAEPLPWEGPARHSGTPMPPPVASDAIPVERPM